MCTIGKRHRCYLIQPAALLLSPLVTVIVLRTTSKPYQLNELELILLHCCTTRLQQLLRTQKYVVLIPTKYQLPYTCTIIDIFKAKILYYSYTIVHWRKIDSKTYFGLRWSPLSFKFYRLIDVFMLVRRF